jgi:hypothetical protein
MIIMPYGRPRPIAAVHRPAGLAWFGPGGPATDDVAMPAQDRIQGDQQRQPVPTLFWYHGEQGCQECPVRPVQVRAAWLVIITAGRQGEQLCWLEPSTLARAIDEILGTHTYGHAANLRTENRHPSEPCQMLPALPPPESVHPAL